ncbi:DUF5391 family protein [Bacillus cereus]|uniref:DUF5391 family protein n=2 Tax=Bacillaceae TaxID=186817 RepID=UPI00077A0830|nr:DUF5391 family protein [Bacillus cereus]KXY56747.1 hypothetical protein AT261_10125 [Bacillus cereus]
MINIMSQKKWIIIVTLISAVLFCSLLIASSLSPLADSGPKANKFGSIGMWSSIGIILVLYIVPLSSYIAGANSMKYIMAVFCGFGLMIDFSILGVILFMNKSEQIIPNLLGPLSFCIAGLIINIIWLIVAFRTVPTSTKANY